MLPWIELGRTIAPGGNELRLMRRGDEYTIKLGTMELMNSRRGGSEIALGTLACDRLGGRRKPHVLIGGLGMGFTLRAVLAALGPDARVTVAELVPAVAEWARGPMAPVFGDCLDDPRVEVQIIDVARLIAAGGVSGGTWDAILLDTDNGPEGMTAAANDALYDLMGLSAIRMALKSAGVLAVWSATSDRRFPRKLAQIGFDVKEHKVPSHGGRGGARHVVWIAGRDGGERTGRGDGPRRSRPAR